jgi:DNA-binding CsgD family transcriptional regulator
MAPICVDPARDPAVKADAALSLVVEQVGATGFFDELLGFFHRAASASDLAVFTLAAGVPALVDALSLRGQAAQRSGERYLHHGYYRFDNNLRISANEARATYLSHLHVNELPDAAYRAACYDSAGLGERISLLIPARREWVFVNLYRPLRCEIDTPSAIDLLARLAPLLAAATRRHLALIEAPVPTLPAAAALADPAWARLSVRERQVVASVLAGRSAKETARTLGLSPTSIATYRQRAFEKLGVRRQVQLFQRFACCAAPRAD